MIGVKLFLYVVYTTLLVVDITCIADDGSGLVASGEGSGGSAEGSAEPTCTIQRPTIRYCISSFYGQPVLRIYVSAEVKAGQATLKTLIFSISYRQGVPPVIIDYPKCVKPYCGALFIIDWDHEEVYNDTTIKARITAEGCSSSTVKKTGELWTNRIFDITVEDVRETSATIVCELACFTWNIGCVPVDTNLTYHKSSIFGDLLSYSYRTQNITFTNLTKHTTYNVCVNVYDFAIHKPQGVLCETFTTLYQKKNYGTVIKIVLVVVTLIIILIGALVIYYHHYKKRRVHHEQEAVPSVSNPSYFERMRREQSNDNLEENISDQEQERYELESMTPSDDTTPASDDTTPAINYTYVFN